MSTNTSEEELRETVHDSILIAMDHAYNHPNHNLDSLMSDMLHYVDDIMEDFKDYQLKDSAERDKFVIGEDEMRIEVDGLIFTKAQVNMSVQAVNSRLALQRERAKQWDSGNHD